ncbi:TonB-dependent siderophore receptor [Salinimonas lutimaris]|uniref:TonB-dependent siderophore receptor n=1 Tax=Salinimonas lutimaris TaxID=914153 RepID=UPI0010C0F14B|nr:TonB-dependent receptor plug domain-containing protein [Salinimonas lutimaris]
MLPSCFTYRPAAAATLMLFSTMPVLAQTDNNEPSDEIEHIEVVGGYTVAERIDTATGLGLTLLETPQSVSVITAERIQDQALDTVIEVVQNTTGVSFRALDNVRNTLQARGFDIQSYQIDGVPLPWSLAADSGETIADVILYDRVEFVRGSTGLLTGVGDPSGSINLVRKHASSRDFSGTISVAAGSWNNLEATTDVSTGLNEAGTVRGRVVAKYEEGDSYLDIFSNRSSVLYGVIEGDITDNTLLRAGLSYQHNVPEGNFWGGLTALYSDGSPVDWDVSTSTSASWTRWETENSNFFANIAHTFDNGWELQANYNKLKYRKPNVRLLYVYGALDKDTGSGLIAWPYRSAGESDLDSLDIQLKGDYQLLGNLHEFVVGALYSKQDALVQVYDVISSDPLPIDNIFT